MTASTVRILAALLAAALGCSGRPLPPTEGDAAVPQDSGDDAAVTPIAPCHPSDLPGDLSLCGVIDGRSVSYLPPSLQSYQRGMSPLFFQTMGPDGTWLEIRGPGDWTDDEPHQVSGWWLRPPAGWAGAGVWLCGRAGTITHHQDESVDATLSKAGILPACGLGGGPLFLHAEVSGGVVPFAQGGGCTIGFMVDNRRVVFLAPACPQVGVPLSIEGLRIVSRAETTDETACTGAGATLTLLGDAATRFLIDIPSLSQPETCSASLSGGLLMKSTRKPGG